MITWKIVSVDVAPVVGDRDNVVVMARWVCQATQDGKSGAALGATALGAPGNLFVAYNDLTEEAVLAFCWDNGLDRNAVEAKAKADLDNVLAASVVSPELPWQPLQINNL
jgi:hypothetical protein